MTELTIKQRNKDIKIEYFKNEKIKLRFCLPWNNNNSVECYGLPNVLPYLLQVCNKPL